MDSPSRPGAQVVHRVAVLLRLIGLGKEAGADFAELAAAANLTKPTAHRLLHSLAAEGILEKDARTGRWHLGPEVYVMGAIAATRYPIEEIARPSVQRLSHLSGESAFLSMRRGDETVCLMREEGSFPVRSFVLAEGVRFPLGIASAGLAILAHLGDDERERILLELDLSDRRNGVAQSLTGIRQSVRDARRLGYVVNPGRIVEGSWGMAAAIFDRDNQPQWALTLTGIESRFREERQPELGRMLLTEAHRVTTKLRGLA